MGLPPVLLILDLKSSQPVFPPFQLYCSTDQSISVYIGNGRNTCSAVAIANASLSGVLYLAMAKPVALTEPPLYLAVIRNIASGSVDDL